MTYDCITKTSEALISFGSFYKAIPLWENSITCFPSKTLFKRCSINSKRANNGADNELRDQLYTRSNFKILIFKMAPKYLCDVKYAGTRIVKRAANG